MNYYPGNLFKNIKRWLSLYSHQVGEITYADYRSYLMVTLVVVGSLSIPLFQGMNLVLTLIDPKLGVPFGPADIFIIVGALYLLSLVGKRKYQVFAADLITALMIFSAFLYVFIYHDYLRYGLIMSACMFLAPITLKPIYSMIVAAFMFIAFIFMSHDQYRLIDYVSIFGIVAWIVGYAYMSSLAMHKIFESNSRNLNNIKELYHNDKLLFSQLAHRLKTPLTIVLNDITQNQTGLSDNLRSRIREINLAIQEIDELSKMNLSKIGIAKQPTDINQLLKEVTKVAQLLSNSYQKLHKSQITIDLESDERQPLLTYISAPQIREALLNIIDYLIHNLGSNSEAIITLSINSQGKQVKVNLDYKGIEIPKDAFNEILLNNIADQETTKANFVAGPQVSRNLIVANEGRIEHTSSGNAGSVQIYLKGI